MGPRPEKLSVENLPFDSVPPGLRREAVILTNRVWPLKGPLEENIARCLAEKAPDTDAMSQVIWHVMREDGVVVAMAKTFRRIVATDGGERFPVLALAGVLANPDFRGRGYGRQVVAMAWARLNPDLPVSFFQTGVPAFYERMGARLVSNRIYDSTGADCAFWEPHAMIYPAHAPWSADAIDLLGRGW